MNKADPATYLCLKSGTEEPPVLICHESQSQDNRRNLEFVGWFVGNPNGKRGHATSSVDRSLASFFSSVATPKGELPVLFFPPLHIHPIQSHLEFRPRWLLCVASHRIATPCRARRPASFAFEAHNLQHNTSNIATTSSDTIPSHHPHGDQHSTTTTHCAAHGRQRPGERAGHHVIQVRCPPPFHPQPPYLPPQANPPGPPPIDSPPPPSTNATPATTSSKATPAAPVPPPAPRPPAPAASTPLPPATTAAAGTMPLPLTG